MVNKQKVAPGDRKHVCMMRMSCVCACVCSKKLLILGGRDMALSILMKARGSEERGALTSCQVEETHGMSRS
jgi:hypothetical protein